MGHTSHVGDTVRVQSAHNYLGNYEESSAKIVVETIQSEESRIVNSIKEWIGTKTVSSSNISLHQKGLYRKPLQIYVETNWKKVVERV